MRNTHEQSSAVYDHLVKDPIPGPLVPYKTLRPQLFSRDKKQVVVIIRTDNRRHGINEGLRLIGGTIKIIKDVKNEIIIKPNCNTDDHFPRNSHHETIRVIAENLIKEGLSPDKICV